MNKQLAFDSKQNKAMLWDLLYNQSAFNGIPSNKIKEVTSLFEDTIQHTARIMPNTSLLVKNKAAIADIIAALKHHQGSYKQLKSETTKGLQNKEDQKRAEFEKMINPPPPPTPTFSDEVDKPLGKELDAMVNEIIERRTNQEKRMLQNQPSNSEATTWLKGTELQQKKSAHHKPSSLSIGKSVPLSTSTITAIPIRTSKKVSFENTAVQHNKDADASIQQELNDIKKRLEVLEKMNTKKEGILSPYV